MMFIPPGIHQPPKSREEKWKDSVRREQRIRRRRMRERSSLGKKMGSALSTSQGMSTLKIVIIYSILGMVLNGVLPHILTQIDPEMLKDDSQYFGTLGAIIITGVLLVVSLIRGIIQRNKPKQEGSDVLPSNKTLFDPKNR